jgi:phenylalanine-4-hydroxylase
MSSACSIFTEKDHQTWKTLFSAQKKLRDHQLHVSFSEGLKSLEIDEEKIPDLEKVNIKLQSLTGWQGIYTSGLVDTADFFEMLAHKKFPVGHFIRDLQDSSYTPEPDVFHDLYGHLPFFANADYAKFCTEFGHRALKYKNEPQILTEFQRLFWFTIEFGLIKTDDGLRIFGAGIASSFSECAYALSDKPRVHSFDVEKIRCKDFRIDLIQEDLFLLDSEYQLYNCLEAFERPYL